MWTRTAFAVGCSVLALTACSASEAPPAATPDPPPVEAPLPPPAEDVPVPAPPPSAEPPAEPPIGGCDDEVVAAVDEVIAGQLVALAEDDHERALGFASEEFRASVDAAAFELLIDDSYPVIADAVDHRIGRCRQLEPATVEVEVAVRAADGAGAVYVYLLVDEGGWAVGGALELVTTAPDVTDV